MLASLSNIWQQISLSEVQIAASLKEKFWGYYTREVIKIFL